MDAEPAPDCFQLPRGARASDVCPPNLRKLVDAAAERCRTWRDVYLCMRVLDRSVSRAQAAGAPEDAADRTWRIAVAALIEQIEAPAHVFDPWQAIVYAASARPEHVEAANAYIDTLGGPEGVDRIVAALPAQNSAAQH